MLDYELFLPIGFVLLALLGFAYGGLAGYFYFRWERSSDTPRVPVAMAAFAVQYGLVFTIAGSGRYALLPTILLFLTIVALITVIRLGLQAHTKAGVRIALAGFFTVNTTSAKSRAFTISLQNFILDYHL